MVIQAHPKAASGPALPRTELRLIESRRRPQLHLFTYVVGNAFVWALWGAVSLTADQWYWWPVIPFVGWTLVLALHLWHGYRG